MNNNSSIHVVYSFCTFSRLDGGCHKVKDSHASYISQRLYNLLMKTTRASSYTVYTAAMCMCENKESSQRMKPVCQLQLDMQVSRWPLLLTLANLIVANLIESTNYHQPLCYDVPGRTFHSSTPIRS